MARTAPVTWRYRAAIASRTIAAVFGCYAASTAIAMALARLLPMSRAEASTAATMIGVLVLPALVMMVFAVRTAWRAWGWVLGLTLAGAAFAWIAGMPA
jgi:hypothetical protein